MALILAIEPDRRQANQLNSMVRGCLKAELVLADSAERALAALGDRVPDLILTSALLSLKDEAELADRLRTLDGTAAHVQTLTIPVLASPRSRPSSGNRGGVLSALIGDRPHASALEGCDPAVFAEQCAAYIERAAAERASQAQAVEEEAEEPLHHGGHGGRGEQDVQDTPLLHPIQEFTSVSSVSSVVESLPDDSAFELVLVDDGDDGGEERVIEEESDEENVIELDLSTLLEDEEAIVREFGVRNDPMATIASAAPAVKADEQRPVGPEPDVETPPAVVQPPPVERDVWIPARLGVSQLWPAMDSYVAERAAPAVSVDSAEPPAVRESSTKAPAAAMPTPARRRAKAKPIEDEWGFFDPEQCGFAALLAKLEEISDGGDDVPAERPA